MVYNNPATSGIDLSPDFLVDLVERIPEVTMIKESSGDVRRMQRITTLSGGELPFFNGSNPITFPALAAGATGWCTAAPCLIPRECLELVDTVARGEFLAAREKFQTMLPLLEFILGGGLPTTVKAGLALLGRDAGVPRPPLLAMSEDRLATLRQLLVGIGASGSVERV
jgi:4-hydroxy-tetrahydrodipicolinate synthase